MCNRDMFRNIKKMFVPNQYRPYEANDEPILHQTILFSQPASRFKRAKL